MRSEQSFFEKIENIVKLKRCTTISGIVFLCLSIVGLLFILLYTAWFQLTFLKQNCFNCSYVYYIAAVSATIAFGCFTLAFSLKSLEEKHSSQRNIEKEQTERAVNRFLAFISSKEFLYVFDILSLTIYSLGLSKYLNLFFKDEAKFNAEVLKHKSEADFRNELQSRLVSSSEKLSLEESKKYLDKFIYDVIKVFNDLNAISYSCLDDYVILDNFKKADCDNLTTELYLFSKILKLYSIVEGDEVFTSLLVTELNKDVNIN